MITLFEWCKENNNENLLKEWDYSKNGDLTPQNIMMGTQKKVWWICEKGHSYECSVSNKIRGNGCPYCAGKKVLVGFNDLQTIFPEIALEWDYIKNGDLKPQDVTVGTEKRVWWICKKGHSYDSRVNNRVHGSRCPYCAGKKALIGYNDLQTLFPQLASEWDYEKNHPITPKEITIGSKKKFWWKCKEGHVFYSSVGHRTKDERGCPYCTNQKLLKGFNDLETTNPEMLYFWDFDKNVDISPSEVMKGQKTKIWWKGDCGHSWQSSLNNMSHGKRCPICAREQKTSFQEQAIYYYAKKVFGDAINGDWETLTDLELDIYVPSKKIAVEFDGSKWHQSVEKDARKNSLCKEKGITLYRIRDIKCPILPEYEGVQVIDYKGDSDADLENSIKRFFEAINVDMDVNIERDRSLIYNQYIRKVKEKSLAVAFPEIAKEWNYEKNGELTPFLVNAGTSKKVWWKCEKGHEWQAIIGSRTRENGCGCAVCSKKRVWKGENDLETVAPEIAKEWNYERNGKLIPSQVTLHSNKRVWWKCEKGHEWEATVNNRSKGRKCPYCRESRKIRVINLDTGEVFESITAAANLIKVNKRDISYCCSGKRNTAGGFHWGYYLNN